MTLLLLISVVVSLTVTSVSAWSSSQKEQAPAEEKGACATCPERTSTSRKRTCETSMKKQNTSRKETCETSMKEQAPAKKRLVRRL